MCTAQSSACGAANQLSLPTAFCLRPLTRLCPQNLHPPIPALAARALLETDAASLNAAVNATLAAGIANLTLVATNFTPVAGAAIYWKEQEGACPSGGCQGDGRHARG